MAVPDWTEDHWEAFHAGMLDDQIAMDPWVQSLFDFAVYNTEGFGPDIYNKDDLMFALEDYLFTTYEVTMDEVFDWEHFRETYG